MAILLSDDMRTIPDSALERSKQEDAARDWAGQQRASVARMWGDEWRRRGEEFVSGLGAPAAGGVGMGDLQRYGQPAREIPLEQAPGGGVVSGVGGLLQGAGELAGNVGQALGGFVERAPGVVGRAWESSIAGQIVGGLQEQARSSPVGQMVAPFSGEEVARRVAENPTVQAMARPFLELGMSPEEANRRALSSFNLAMGIAGGEAPGGAGRTAGPAASPAGGAAKALPEGAKPINLTPEEEVARLRLDKFPDWARDTIQQAAQDIGFAREQRRGVIPTAVSEQMADDLGRTVEDWIRQGKAGKAYNTEEIRALRNAITAQADAVNQITQRVAEARASGQVTDAMLAQALTEGEKLQALMTVAEGARAEWGRAGLAWRAATRNVASPIENIERIYRKLGGRDNAIKAVDEYNQLVQQGATPIQMANFWSRVEKPPPGFKDWFEALRYNSMMSGPRTFEINMVGNALEVPWRLARDFGASVLRRRPEELAPELAGVWAGLQRGIRPFMETLTQGISTEQALAGDVPRSLSARLTNPVARGGATMLEIPGRLNQATDQVFKQIAYSMGLGRQAAITASKEGLRGQAWQARVAELMAEPSVGMMKAAEEIAERMTFKGDMGTLGNALGGVQRVPYLGNILLPFLRTVYHITARGIDRSPLGFIGTGVDVLRGAYKGGATPQAAAPLTERLGDNLMGTIGALALYGYATQGNISAAGPEDTGKRDLLRASGWQPYSIKVGDRWVSYSNWGPFSVPLAMAASLAEAGLYAKGEADAPAQAMDFFARVGQLATEQTYLQGIGAVIKAVQEPDRYGGQWLTGFMNSLVPYGSAINTIGQATDPYARAPEKISQVGLTEHARQSLMARFPGLREQVPIAQTALGDPSPNTTQGAAAFQPFRIGAEIQDPVERILLDADVNIPRPPATVKNIPLTPAEQRQFQAEAGRLIRQGVQQAITMPTYQKATSEGRKRILEKVVSDARERAGVELLRGLGGESLRERRLGTPAR